MNKYLATCGVASRRAVEQYILGGRVKINGKVTRDLATQVADTDKVEFNGKPVSLQTETVYIVMNKPKGCVTTCIDEKDKGRRTVLDVLKNCEQAQKYRVFPVGRLDYDTSGLLILTNDGDFAREITHPSSQIPKTYIATVTGDLSKAYDDKHMTIINSTTIQVTICEGQNRQVRKMLANIGLDVIALKRVAIGNLTLGNLKSGEFVCLNKKPLI